MQPWLVRTDSSTGLDWTLCAWRTLEHKLIAISMSFEKGTAQYQLQYQCLPGPQLWIKRQGNWQQTLLLFSGSLLCKIEVISANISTSYMSAWSVRFAAGWKPQTLSCWVLSQTLSALSLTSLTHLLTCSPLGVVTWCIFLQFGDESMWSGCHPRCTVNTSSVVHESVVLMSRLPLARCFGLASGAVENSQTESLWMFLDRSSDRIVT